MSEKTKFAIIGAGPAGLVLARILQMNNIACTVFASDRNRHARSQGGSLDLHEGSAQRALQTAGLLDIFEKHSRPEGESLRIFGPNDQLVLDESRDSTNGRPEEMHGRPEIDRVLLRNLLLDSLDNDTVRWAHKLEHIEQSADQTYTLYFGNGSAERFNYLVGADGAWSKVRPLVTAQMPYFSGVTGIDIQVSDAASRRPQLAERVGKGMCLNLGEDRGILTQWNGDGSIRVYALMRAAEDWHQTCGIDFSQADTAKEAFAESNFGDWSRTARNFILQSDDEISPRPIYMLPIGLAWEQRAGVTLIGDAAHLMSPFAGVGVNVAMEDALELALRIVGKANEDINAALRDYELEMFARAESYAKQSYMFLNIFFNQRGAAAMMDHFAAVRAAEKANETAEQGHT